MAEGKSNADIAAAPNISTNTVKVHIASIFRKTGAANRHEAIAKLTYIFPDKSIYQQYHPTGCMRTALFMRT